MSIEAKPYCDAAKLDILDLLDKPAIGLFEFRQITAIAQAMELLVDAVGTPTEQGIIRITLDMAEYKAPNLHKALINRAFDGEELLQKKYAKMLDEHTQVRHAALQIQTARSELAQEQTLLSSHKSALREHEQQLRIERERLQLEASNQGRNVNLPALPQLTDPDAEESDTEPKPGAAWDPNDPDGTYKRATEED
jgi:hypothetical protein